MASKRARDSLTLDLFEVPREAQVIPGHHDLDGSLRAALTDALKHASGDRYLVAAEMSRLTGREISKYMLDAYTAESRSDHNFPFRYAAAFEIATDSYCLTQLLARLRGCRVLVGEEALLAELGRIEQMETELREQKRAVKRYLQENKK